MTDRIDTAAEREKLATLAAARALIAAQPDLLFRCDLCPDECNCHPHHDMSMSGEYILCDGCEDFDNPKGVPDPLTLIATLAGALEAERADVAAAYVVAASVCRERHLAYEKMTARAERSGPSHPEYICDSTYHHWSGKSSAYSEMQRDFRALTPADAEASLDKMLAKARQEATAWQPIETAPKDGTDILVYYSHDADPYRESETRLTPYAAWAEGGDFMDGSGMCIAAWQPEHWEPTGDYGDGYYLPAYWFAHQMGDYEYVVNPTHWMPLPAPPTDTPRS